MKNDEKKFGFMLAVIVGGFSVFHYISNNFIFSTILICLSFIFLFLAFKSPFIFKQPVILWLKFGESMQKIMTPIVLSILFGAIFIPVGFLLKIFKKDSLNLKFEKNTVSYWKTEVKNPQSSFRTQF